MKHTLLAAAAAFALFAAPAFAQDSQPATAAMPAPPAQEFVTMAANGDMFEIQSSEIAVDKAQNADVKQFAQQMIADHTKASQELKLAVEATGQYDIPTELDAKHQEMLDGLKDKTDSEFDAAYVDAQVMAHEEALALMVSYSEGGDDEALKAHAAKSAPIIQMHYEMITKMDASM